MSIRSVKVVMYAAVSVRDTGLRMVGFELR